MPDLITHVAAAHLIRRPFERSGRDAENRRYRVLFYLGTILPDVTSRAVNIAFPSSMKWTLALHTPAGALVLIGILALLFEPGMRKRAFGNLTAGAFLHFLLDTFQTSSTPVFFWLFPFSWADCGLNWVDPGDLIPWIPVWLAGIGFLELVLYLRRRRESASHPVEKPPLESGSGQRKSRPA
ncbi:MAG TPA: DUF1624 domain-containing protein [bacterium]|nr:DUF1624 domain-containing protein [bacterium]